MLTSGMIQCNPIVDQWGNSGFLSLCVLGDADLLPVAVCLMLCVTLPSHVQDFRLGSDVVLGLPV
jgi:hypothetical protein